MRYIYDTSTNTCFVKSLIELEELHSHSTMRAIHPRALEVNDVEITESVAYIISQIATDSPTLECLKISSTTYNIKAFNIVKAALKAHFRHIKLDISSKYDKNITNAIFRLNNDVAGEILGCLNYAELTEIRNMMGLHNSSAIARERRKLNVGVKTEMPLGANNIKIKDVMLRATEHINRAQYIYSAVNTRGHTIVHTASGLYAFRTYNYLNNGSTTYSDENIISIELASHIKPKDIVSISAEEDVFYVNTKYGLYIGCFPISLIKPYIIIKISIPGSNYENDVLQVISSSSRSIVITKRGIYRTERPLGNPPTTLNKREFFLVKTKLVPWGLISKLNDIISVAIGGSNTFIHTKDGLYVQGNNLSGSLGVTGDYKNDLVKLVLPNGIDNDNIIKVVASFDYTVMITTKGVYSCGDNTFHQLGLGVGDESINTFQKMILPVGVADSDVVDAYLGSTHTIIRTRYGLYGCGDNFDGELGFPENDIIDTLQHLPLPDNIALDDIKGVVASKGSTVIITSNNVYNCGKWYQGLFAPESDSPPRGFVKKLNIDKRRGLRESFSRDLKDSNIDSIMSLRLKRQNEEIDGIEEIETKRSSKRRRLHNY
jgi:hypothetical protein